MNKMWQCLSVPPRGATSDCIDKQSTPFCQTLPSPVTATPSPCRENGIVVLALSASAHAGILGNNGLGVLQNSCRLRANHFAPSSRPRAVQVVKPLLKV